MSANLEGKVALVTGGGRGIGKAIAFRLAQAGANVVIASRKIENLDATAKEFAGLPGRTVPMACHVGRKEDLEKLVTATEAQLGPVDILVNNSATNLGQGRSYRGFHRHRFRFGLDSSARRLLRQRLVVA